MMFCTTWTKLGEYLLNRAGGIASVELRDACE
jgi:hypothetical protein